MSIPVSSFTYSHAGYIPVRLMFFEPNREQAIRIQSSLKKLYENIGGEYYSGEAAWEYVKEETGIDMKALFKNIGGDSNAV